MTDESGVPVPIEPDRVMSPRSGDERAMLEGWLDWHRATLVRKCAGLTVGQLRSRAAQPSTLSLLGLVRHMAEVDGGWFHDLDGEVVPPLYTSDAEPEADIEGAATSDAFVDFANFDRQVARSRETAARHSLEAAQTDSAGRPVTLRWVYLHMIEEYARHNGHADLLRERIDGATGD